MTAGRSDNNGKDAARRDSSETGLRIDLLRKSDRRLICSPAGTVSGYRDCYRILYRVLAHGIASAGGSAAWRPWRLLNPPKMAPFLAAPNNRAATAENKIRLESLRVFVLRGRVPALGPMAYLNITYEPIVAANSPHFNRLNNNLRRIR